MIEWTVTVEKTLARVVELRELARRDTKSAGEGAEVLRADVLAAIADGSAQDARALAKVAMFTIDEAIGGS